jgi:hypothetical protein
MDIRNTQNEKSKKIRELFGLDKMENFIPTSQVPYNEEVFFKSLRIETEKVSDIISSVVNSVSLEKFCTTANKVNINVSPNYFENNINCIVHSLVVKHPSTPNDNKFCTSKSGNNISIDNCSTISSQLRTINVKNNSLEINNEMNKKTYFFVPCINCNNLIHIDDIGMIN